VVESAEALNGSGWKKAQLKYGPISNTDTLKTQTYSKCGGTCNTDTLQIPLM